MCAHLIWLILEIKKITKIFEKGIDKSPGQCYNTIRKDKKTKNQKKGKKKMNKIIDLTMMSYHTIVERANRVNNIENSIGWGEIVAEAPDRNDANVRRALTSTGVLLVLGENDFIITAWVAEVRQAAAVWKKANNGARMPRQLWNMVNYNNNTTYWQNLVAA